MMMRAAVGSSHFSTFHTSQSITRKQSEETLSPLLSSSDISYPSSATAAAAVKKKEERRNYKSNKIRDE
jgi:hypothetical protein